jgi:hypothetical protein
MVYRTGVEARSMPMYFFHIREGEEVILDLEGAELPDIAAAQKAALEGASSLIAEAVKRGERNFQGRLDVEDGHGQRVLTVSFACPIQIDVAPLLSDCS